MKTEMLTHQQVQLNIVNIFKLQKIHLVFTSDDENYTKLKPDDRFLLFIIIMYVCSIPCSPLFSSIIVVN